MKKKIEDVAFPRIITTNKRLKKLKREARKLGVSVQKLVEEKLRVADRVES